MEKNRILKLASYVSASFIIILMISCGSGRNNSPISEEISPQVNTRASQAAKKVLGILMENYSLELSKKVLAKTSAKVLGKHASGICSSGGTYTFQIVNSNTTEEVFTDCRSEVSLAGTSLILIRNGVIKKEYLKKDHWIETRTQYVEEYFDKRDGKTLLRRAEDNYTMEIEAPAGTPGVREVLQSIFWAHEGTMKWYDRVPREDGSVVPEEWTIEFLEHRWETTYVYDGYQTDQSELSESVQDGTWIFTDHLNPAKSYKITYKNFVTTEYIDSFHHWVNTVDGVILDDCNGEEIIVETLIPTRTPVVYPSVCPIEGKVRFTMANNSSVITHTLSGMDIDADGDGKIDERLEGCSLTPNGCF